MDKKLEDFYERELESQNETFKYYGSEFCHNICTVLGIKPKETKALKALAYEIYMEDCSYRGLDDAWVCESAIKRFASEGHYSEWMGANKYSNLLAKKFGSRS